MSSKNSKFFVMAASLAKQLFAPEFFNLDFDKLQGALLHYEAVKLTKALLHNLKKPLLFPSNDAAELLQYMAEHAYGTGNNFCYCYCTQDELWEMVQTEDDYNWFKTVVSRRLFQDGTVGSGRLAYFASGSTCSFMGALMPLYTVTVTS